MKSKTRKAISLIVALLVAVLMTVGYVFAWLVDRVQSELIISGTSAGAYFDSGNGSQETPFIIANPTHMHNLAVLQNTGKFVDRDGNPKKYYFAIKETVETINMAGHYIPPIGNDENPFIGDFDGRGKTLANLQVTTKKSDLSEEYPRHAEADYEFSQAVGLFGMTGEQSDIHNVILENPSVYVSASDTLYSATKNAAVGLAVGFVAGKCSSIGVRAKDDGSALSVNVSGYSTFNSILGALGENVSSSVTGGGHTAGTGGSGSSFGANFDVEGMYDRLKKIEVNKNSTPSWRLPNLGDSSKESITIASLDKLPFAVDAASTYDGADAREVIANNNIGYLLGNQNKVYNKDLNFGDLLVEGALGNWTYSDGKTPANGKFPRWIYKTTATEIGGDYYNSGNGFAPLTQEEFDALPEGIQDLVPAASGTVTGFNSIRLSQTYQNAAVQIYPGSDGNGQWTPHGQISWMGKTYGEGLTKTNYKGDAIDEDELQFTAEGYKIDENGFMFSADGYFVNTEWPLPGNVDEEGYLVDGDGNRTSDIDGDEIKYGGYKLGSDADGYYLIKDNGNALTLDMGWGSTKRVTPKVGTPVALYNYTNGVALPNCGIWFKPAQSGKIRFVMYAETSGDGFALIKGHRTNATKENPFTVDYSKNGSDVTATEVGKYKIPKNVLFYFEFDVSEEDIEDGRYEYWLMQYGSGGAYFVYLDMGASAADDTSGIDREKAVSAIDFIYDGVEIRQGDPSADAADAVIKVGDFIVKSSGAAEAFEKYESSKTSVYFDDLKAVLNLVFIRLYSGSSSHTDKTKTICLEKSDPVPDKNSEVHATFATYVCPSISGGSGSVSGGGTVTPTPDPEPTISGVTITPAAATVTVGETTELVANVTMSDGSVYEGSVVWASSDENIAAVENGVVTAKAAGSVTITATAEGESATCTITVNAPPKETVDVTLSAADYTAQAGKPLTVTNEYLSITSSAGKNYKYVASNAAVGGPVLVGSGNGRDMIITADGNIESITLILKMAVAGNEALTTGGSATVTGSAGATVSYADGTDVNGSVTTQANGTVIELKIILGAGQTVTIDSTGRLAFISASAEVTLAS